MLGFLLGRRRLRTGFYKTVVLSLIALPLWVDGKLALAVSSSRPISVADCVRTKRVYRAQVQLSPDGKEVAYVVKAPDIQKNKNEFQVHLRAVTRDAARSNGRLLYKSEDSIDGLRWTRNPSRVVFLEQRAGVGRIISLDPRTGTIAAIARAEGLTSFSADAEGKTFVYAAESDKSASDIRQKAEEYGFPIIFGQGVEPGHSVPKSSLFMVRAHESSRSTTRQLSLRWNDDASPVYASGVQALSLSPDGRFLTFNYQASHIPQRWNTNPYTKFCELEGAEPMVLGILELRTRILRIAVDAPSAGFGLPTVWSADSRAFSVVALSPAGSFLEDNDRKLGFHDGIQFEHYTHLFSVSVDSLQTSVVIQQPTNWYQNDTLFWPQASGNMLVQETTESYGWFAPENSSWKRKSESRLPFGQIELRAGVFLAPLNASSNGHVVVGVRENVSTPPDLFIHDLATARTKVMTDLNPGYRDLKLGEIESLEWTDDLGFRNTGYLIKPVGFQTGKLYPLVIMVKGWGNFFLADTHFQTAFPPQPLAASGFLVLMANLLPLDKIPGGYIGKMGEGYQFIAMVKAAVRDLGSRGLLDPTRVGLIGFSNTSWQTDFMITHSDFPFAAVSSADSGIYNYAFYWLLNSKQAMNDYEEELGGPPYGDTLANTFQFAPAFNAQNVRYPLLMEYTRFPGDLTGNMEFFVALKRQGKAVELFSYPTGEHDLDVPSQRLASLQRNVDWFRFWMLGLEGSPPGYDPEQFVRWNELKKNSSRASKGPVNQSVAAPGGN